MAHAPGTPEQKRALLSVLDEAQLPYLVADLLVLGKGHRDVRVVDGPGDGRRDIHSVDAAGNKFLTQCKYHADVSAAVGSRETDELPLALMKFGAKRGLFVTTARLSPQSKREYLEDFPDFELEFMDGVVLVTDALAVPAIHAAWLSPDGLRRTSALVALPFAVRSLEDDAPRTSHTEPAVDGLSVVLERIPVGRHVFQPYRTFTAAYTPDDGSGAQAAVVLGASLHGSLQALDSLRHGVAKACVHAHETRAIRFGTPAVVHPAAGGYSVGPLIATVQSQTLIAISDGRVTTERDHVVPQGDEWAFPYRVTTLTRHYCHWYNRRSDCLLLISIDSPQSEIEQLSSAHARALLAQSLSIRGPEEAIAALRSALPEAERPETVIEAGDQLLAFWPHPRANGPVMLKTSRDDAPGEEDDDPFQSWAREVDEEFVRGKTTILQLASSYGCRECPWTTARKYLDLAGELSSFPEVSRIQSADLLYFLERHPSPLDLRTRRATFLQIMSVPEDVSAADLAELANDAAPGVSIGYVEPGDVRHLAVAITQPTPVSFPASELIGTAWANTVQGLLAAARARIVRRWSEATLATRAWWQATYEVVLS